MSGRRAAGGAGAPRLLALGRGEAAVVEALAGRLLPGSCEAGALAAVDWALARGPAARDAAAFRRDLGLFDRLCVEVAGAPFLRLEARRQEAVLRRIDRSAEPDAADRFGRLCALVYEHALEALVLGGPWAAPRGGA